MLVAVGEANESTANEETGSGEGDKLFEVDGPLGVILIPNEVFI